MTLASTLQFLGYMILLSDSNNLPERFNILPTFKNEMILIRGGVFNMGDSFGMGASDEQPIHSVFVNDFYMSKYEVTVKEYRQFCFEARHLMPEEPSWGWIDDHPIVHVSWYDAVKFCKWLSKKTGKKFRLPYEAEWEYAARNGGKDKKFPTGDSITKNQENIDNYLAWKDDPSLPGTTSVGSYKPNDLNLFDLGGNVHEWVFDYYDELYYHKSPSNNPKGPSSGTARVERGGSWRSPPEFSRCANRNFVSPSFKIHNLGFRLCVSK